MVEILPDAGARITGAEIVFVPEVFSAPIATAFESPVSAPMLVAKPVRVSVFGLVADGVYPLVPVPEK